MAWIVLSDTTETLLKPVTSLDQVLDGLFKSMKLFEHLSKAEEDCWEADLDVDISDLIQNFVCQNDIFIGVKSGTSPCVDELDDHDIFGRLARLPKAKTVVVSCN